MNKAPVLAVVQTFWVRVITHANAFLRKHAFLWLLAALFVSIRLFYISNGTIPFSFDHGKDSIAVMHMVSTFSPKLTGPWTSIPGLHFGPFWYYLLAPSVLLFNYHPLAPVLTMMGLFFVLMMYVYFKFGIIEATIITTGGIWISFTTSAWNPFPMVVLTFAMIGILKAAPDRQIRLKDAWLLGLLSGLGFSFSAAYAIFYPICILFYWFLNAYRITLKSLLSVGFGLTLAVAPQILFELLHNFQQVRAVISYFSQPEPHQLSVDKIVYILEVLVGEIRAALIPSVYNISVTLNTLIGLCIVSLISLSIIRAFLIAYPASSAVSKNLWRASTAVIAFTVVPIVGFFFLHFNVWYVYALLPPYIWLVGSAVSLSKQWIRQLYIVLLITAAIAQLLAFGSGLKYTIASYRTFLPVKLSALTYIRQQAGTEAFASYHYVPDIYDYTYQYLYLWQGFQGKSLPTDFSYKPGETAYIPEKAELLKQLSAQAPSTKPARVFFIIEKPERLEFLNEWWNHQKFAEIIDEHWISPEVVVYTATPYVDE